MSEKDPAPGLAPRCWLLFLGLGVVITVADLWSKQAVFKFLGVQTAGDPPQISRPPPDEHPVIEGWFHLEASYNYGAFNGWFSDHTGALAILSLTALFIITGIVWFSLRAHAKGKQAAPSFWFVTALGLIAGGTAGNFYDRYALRAVRDFIKWFYVDAGGEEHVWPNFNIADSSICAGVLILVTLEFGNHFRERAEKKKKQAEQTG